MKYGFTLPGRGPLAAPENLGVIARKGEELGFDALLTGDHILVPRHISSVYPYTESGEFPGSGSGESMEQITLLSYIAGQTSKIRLVTSVLIVPHRNPLIAAKALATLDVLSGGRLVVGVGVGRHSGRRVPADGQDPTLSDRVSGRLARSHGAGGDCLRRDPR